MCAARHKSRATSVLSILQWTLVLADRQLSQVIDVFYDRQSRIAVLSNSVVRRSLAVVGRHCWYSVIVTVRR